MLKHPSLRWLLLFVFVAAALAFIPLASGYNKPEAAAALKKGAAKPPTSSTSTTVPNSDGVPAEYKLVYYQNVPGVPQNYFGPACVPNGNAQKCKKDLEQRIKHDPMLLSVQMRNFKLLPGWNAKLSADQVESLRHTWQLKLAADWHLRQEWSIKVSGVLDSLQKLHIEALSGPYYTEYVTKDGKVHQAQKRMDPRKNIALVGTDQEGRMHDIKLDCGHQTVSKQPIPGTPKGSLPPSEKPTKPSTPTTLKCAHVHSDGMCVDVNGPQNQTQPSSNQPTTGYDPHQDQPHPADDGHTPTPQGSGTGSPTSGPVQNPVTPAPHPGSVVPPTPTTTGSGGGSTGTTQPDLCSLPEWKNTPACS